MTVNEVSLHHGILTLNMNYCNVMDKSINVTVDDNEEENMYDIVEWNNN